MEILVTGATGFVGHHLVPVLLESGVDVLATYRDSAKVKGIPWCNQVEWREFDIFNPPDNPYESLGKPDRMIHMAWSGLPNYKDDFHLEKNLPANLDFLGGMFEGGLRHLLVTGTCFEYGLKEGEMFETTPAMPDNSYGEAKNLLRISLEKTAASAGAVLQWCRLFYMYGSGQGERSLFAQLQNAIDSGASEFDMSGGQQIRDFMAVEAVAQSLAAIVLQTEVSGIINVCSARAVTVQTLVEEYLASQGSQMKLNLGVYPYPNWEPYRFWGNNGKLCQVIQTV